MEWLKEIIKEITSAELTEIENGYKFNCTCKEWHNTYDEETKVLEFKEIKYNTELKVEINEFESHCSLGVSGHDEGFGSPYSSMAELRANAKRRIEDWLITRNYNFKPPMKPKWVQMTLF